MLRLLCSGHCVQVTVFRSLCFGRCVYVAVFRSLCFSGCVSQITGSSMELFLGDLRSLVRFVSFWKKRVKLDLAKSNHL